MQTPFDKLVTLIHDTDPLTGWSIKAESAFGDLFNDSNNSNKGYYPQSAKDKVQFRCPEIKEGISYAAIIDKSNPTSGAYGGMSFVIFPAKDKQSPCLISMCLGTQGLNPDEMILGKPGHARKMKAICSWINNKSNTGMTAWAKDDPVRMDKDIPENIKEKFSIYGDVFQRYGKELYAIFIPNNDIDVTKEILQSFLNVFFKEKNSFPLAASKKNAEKIEAEYFKHIMPDYSEAEVFERLNKQSFVIIQGPPGTGKTRMALNLIKKEYNNNGFSIQFHPNTTYEDFIGGLFPKDQKDSNLGFLFSPKHGYLLEAINNAKKKPDEKYLLHIDEINRADLSKVLGEAIFLFERKLKQIDPIRKINLSYSFPGFPDNLIELPENLHILGTMNSADRSIAILDVAVRRRFAFIEIWPQLNVLDNCKSCDLMKNAFKGLINIFVEHAPEEVFNLLPGHSYFLCDDENESKKLLKFNLVPLLEEYIWQGYVSSFDDKVKAYIQEIICL